VKINCQRGPIDSAWESLLIKASEYGLDDQDSILDEVIIKKNKKF
jgi:hypothetical protein